MKLPDENTIIYSIEERIIGISIDNGRKRHVYRKVIETTSPNVVNEAVAIAKLPENTETFIDIKARVYLSEYHSIIPIPFASDINNTSILFNDETKELLMSIKNPAYQSRRVIIIIDYLKINE